MFMFGAGQDTSAKLLGNSMKYLVERPELQDHLRADPSLIPAFLEEVLRIEGSTKQTARLARKDTQIGDVHIPAGTRILVALSAANRDPGRWENPNELILNRPKIKRLLHQTSGSFTATLRTCERSSALPRQGCYSCCCCSPA